MGAAAVPLMIISTAVSAYSAYQQGQAASEAANYNAKVANANAQMTEAQGVAASEALQRNQQRQIGAAMAQYGASGVDPGSGSPMDVLQSSVREATLDQATTKYNYDVRANAYRNQSNLYGMQSSQASTAGMLNSLGALAQGASSYAMYSNPNAFKTTGTPIPGMGAAA